MLKFAANISLLFREHEFMDRFAAAAAAGFKGVEFLFPYAYAADAMAEALHKHEQQNVLFNLPPGDWDAGERGIAALAGRQAQFQDSVGLALEYAAVLGTPRLHVMAGIPPEGHDLAECEHVFVENLRWAAKHCADRDITLLIEPINQRDMPGYFLSYQEHAQRILAAVAMPNVKLQLDLYHCQVMQGDLTTCITQLIDEVGHIQIAGVPQRHEPNAGELNLPYLLGHLNELGYPGWVGCEYHPASDTVSGLKWLADVAHLRAM